MTPLRQRMIREMELRQFSPCTIESYQTAVSGLSEFYHRSPDQLNLEEIRSYLHHLLTEQKVAQSTCNQRAAGLTFFYRHVLGQEAFDLKIRRKHSGKLPEVYRVPRVQVVQEQRVLAGQRQQSAIRTE